MSDKLNLHQKLLEIQKQLDCFLKDGRNLSEKYDYVKSDTVLDTVRPKMNELNLLLIPIVTESKLHESSTKSGTTRYMTELTLVFKWVDCESSETLEVPFYSQGVDLAGEKGVGKALTYAEKYFLMKFFHVPTSKDDPDQSGAGKHKNTQAQKENEIYYKKSTIAMLHELCNGEPDKIKQSIMTLTSNKEKGITGVDDIEKVSPVALPILYSKTKKKYMEVKGKEFKLEK